MVWAPQIHDMLIVKNMSIQCLATYIWESIMRCKHIVSPSCAGLGALVAVHYASYSSNVHIHLLGRSVRPTVTNALLPSLQAGPTTNVVMMRCDICLTEEAAVANDSACTSLLMQVIHAGKGERSNLQNA